MQLDRSTTSSLWVLLLGGIFAGACGSSEPTGSLDGGTPGEDSAIRLDSGVGRDATPSDAVGGDSQPAPDATVPPDVGFVDGGLPDAVALPDATSPDAMTMPVPELVPGSHVRVTEGRINIRQDGYSDIIALLGAGTRTATPNTRSYEWTLSGGVQLTIWFANSNLDNDDAPPNDVDATDRVLWVAVQGGFTGTTPDGIGLSSNRTAVDAAYGAAPHNVAITSPAGSLAQYFELGLLVAYDQADSIRTITVCRAYPQAPDGTIDVDDSRLQFTARNLQAYTFVGNFPIPHDDQGDARGLLGEPDGEGNVVISGQNLRMLSWAFIGIEVFSAAGMNDIAFFSIHAPYYGTASGGAGIGSSRADFEAHLTSRNYGAAAPSSTANFFCYSGSNNDPDVGVSYSMAAPVVVTTITIPLHQCP